TVAEPTDPQQPEFEQQLQVADEGRQSEQLQQGEFEEISLSQQEAEQTLGECPTSQSESPVDQVGQEQTGFELDREECPTKESLVEARSLLVQGREALLTKLEEGMSEVEGLLFVDADASSQLVALRAEVHELNAIFD